MVSFLHPLLNDKQDTPFASTTYANKRILIIEDQRPFLLLLRGLVNNLGAKEVGIAHSADQALSMCRKQKFDVVIADLHLGADKKNGFELIEELRIRKMIKASTVFLIMSADSARPMVLGSLERRPDDYIVKPFSQAQLKSRINRAWLKRQFMLPVYDALFKDDIYTAIKLVKGLAKQSSIYQRYCVQVLVELYWQTEQLDNALALLTHDEKAMPALWTQIALAKTHLLKGNAEQSAKLAKQILVHNRFNAEAYDILAESESILTHKEEAITAIKQAIKISPLSLNRQYIACRIARENGDWELLTESSLQIWELSKRTVHQDIQHWCNHIASILDAAEASDDRRVKNRYQQEALLLIHRSQFDDNLSKVNQDFDLSIFEKLVNARVSLLDGKLIEAKAEMLRSQLQIERRYDEYPAGFAPESLKVMFDLGEFEEAANLMAQLKAQGTELDPNSQYLMGRIRNRAERKQADYATHNKRGITLYQQGKFEEARIAFLQAQEHAPVNTGVALNLLQCNLKILAMNTKPEPVLVRECKQVFKTVDGMPLKPHHQQKLDGLLEDLTRYIKHQK